MDQAVNAFAARGYRALGVAQTNAQGRWQFLAILPLYDPPREDSKATLDTAKRMGVRVKMVTGDQVAIGKEIAKQVGIGPNILDAALFQETKHHEGGRLADTIETADGFAQVYPERKYHIVEVLQNRGHVVGMTGDGVNDAPALKKADAGIAVSGATDAARSAADMVLLSPGLSVIIGAIQESRKIFQRTQSYAIYRIAETNRYSPRSGLPVQGLLFDMTPPNVIRRFFRWRNPSGSRCDGPSSSLFQHTPCKSSTRIRQSTNTIASRAPFLAFSPATDWGCL